MAGKWNRISDRIFGTTLIVGKEKSIRAVLLDRVIIQHEKIMVENLHTSLTGTFYILLGLFLWGCVVVVYQCSISNVMYIVDIEALFVSVHAVLDC